MSTRTFGNRAFAFIWFAKTFLLVRLSSAIEHHRTIEFDLAQLGSTKKGLISFELTRQDSWMPTTAKTNLDSCGQINAVIVKVGHIFHSGITRLPIIQPNINYMFLSTFTLFYPEVVTTYTYCTVPSSCDNLYVLYCTQ